VPASKEVRQSARQSESSNFIWFAASWRPMLCCGRWWFLSPRARSALGRRAVTLQWRGKNCR